MSRKGRLPKAPMRDGLNAFFSLHPEVARAGALIAYSGGVDSATLLSALSKSDMRPLRAVHIVHNLRPAEELQKERETIVAFCKHLRIPLTIATVKPGTIEKLAQRKGIGIEAAARELRYKILKSIARRFGFEFICTAHTADDQLETLLARFIASSSLDGLAGMEQIRAIGKDLKLARPLLFATRGDIASYAEKERLPVSEDSSNAALRYTRNRIRHVLVPLLDKDFKGWRKGLSRSSEKLAADKVVLQESLGRAMDSCSIDAAKRVASIDLAMFMQAPDAIRTRLLARCLSAVLESGRLSYSALRAASSAIVRGATGVDLLGARLSVRGTRLELLPILDFQVEDRYFFLIPREGSYRAGPIFASLCWEANDKTQAASGNRQGFLLERSFSFPLILRSRKPGDRIKADGVEKRLDDIIKAWRPDRRWREKIPVIEDRDGIVAVLPSALEGPQLEYEKFRDYEGSRLARKLYIRVKGA